MDAEYTLSAGSPITMVNVISTMPDNTLAAGIVLHPKGKALRNTNEAGPGGWRYLATWGPQSDQGENLGLVVFFRNGEAGLTPNELETRSVRFRKPIFTYAFAAIWGQGPMGINDQEAFVAWCNEQQTKLPPPKGKAAPGNTKK